MKNKRGKRGKGKTETRRQVFYELLEQWWEAEGTIDKEYSHDFQRALVSLQENKMEWEKRWAEAREKDIPWIILRADSFDKEWREWRQLAPRTCCTVVWASSTREALERFAEREGLETYADLAAMPALDQGLRLSRTFLA